MRKVSVVAIMGLCFVAGIAFVYSCGGGSSSSAGTIGELEGRVLALENKLTPAYDSGWLDIAQGENKYLNHGLGLNIDDFVIDVMQFTNEDGIPAYYSNTYTGTSRDGAGLRGVRWKILSSWDGIPSDSAIMIHRGLADNYGEKIRVRIWDLGS